MVLHSLDLSPILRKCVWIVCCTSVQTNGPVLYQAGTAGNTHDRAYTLHQTQEQNTALLSRHECSQQGRVVVLVCNKDVGAALRKACEHDTDSDAVHLPRAATIVRRDMLKMKNEFSGSFDAQCQEKSVPVSLLALVSMVLCDNPDQFCIYASTSSHPLTATHIQLFGMPEQDCHHN